MAYKSPNIQSAEFCCRFAFYVCDAETRLPLQMTIAQETWVDRTVTEVTLRQ